MSALSGCVSNPSEVTKPNVLFISIDDLKPLIGAMGNPYIKTPNMDRLAHSGRAFVNSHCQFSLCGPSRNSILTGLRPDTTKCYKLTDKVYEKMPDAVSIGQHFKEQGYWTEANGKIFHHGTDDARAWSIPWTEGVENGELWYINPENRSRVEAMTQRYRYTEWVSNPAFVKREYYSLSLPGNVILDREFYDYEADPLETRNLIDDPVYQDLVREHAELLHQ